MERIGVIGVGGVGGYFGGKLCRIMASDQSTHIFFIARGAHLDEIRETGLIVSTVGEGEFICRPTLATDRATDLPALDLCLLCVKAFDLTQILKEINQVITEETLIVPLLNGVDIYERTRAAISQGFVFPACVYIGAHIERPGKVVQMGGDCKILFGKDPRHQDHVPYDVLRLFERSGIKHERVDDPFPAIWEKFMFIASFGLVTACFDQTIGQVIESRELSDYVLGIIREIDKIARSKGVKLPRTAVEDSFRKGKGFPHSTKTSFQRDFEQTGKADERDLFGGTILRLGQSLGIEVPFTRKVYEELQNLKRVGLD